ncbi:hypothetical protein NSU_3221 [Novosphingobium pentaromativorans US6-1]|uniref:Uncharacterized protein n=1 Tax=Novosphingobium pentaromativorans US6-1 TaxID=1088721 RepID=G6EFV1_9SPHN|nr:hypothetical protein NSU_3221 [Novosphingobium pentaromativorans US6-1]
MGSGVHQDLSIAGSILADPCLFVTGRSIRPKFQRAQGKSPNGPRQFV